MILHFGYVILLTHYILGETMMRYQGSQDNKNDTLANVLSVVNFLLLAVIAACANYVVVNFLF